MKAKYSADGEISKLTGLQGTANASTVYIAYEVTFKNQPRTMINPLGRTTTLGHNAFGTLSNITDPLGNKDVLLRDKLGRVTSQIDPMGQTTQISHDANGNPTRVTTPKGGVYSTRYDPLNRPNGSTDPLNRTDSAEYDGNGNLTKSTDRKGQVTLNTYDALDRLKQVRFHDGSTIDYTWDAGNRVTKIADGINGTFDYTYDAHDRLTQEAGPKGTVNYSYDAAGRRTGMQVIAQSTTVSTSYAYDAADRLTRITQAAGASNDNQAQVTTYAWDAANRLTSKTLPNGITATYTWDAASQLKEIGYAKGGNSLGKLTYSYDAAGRRTSIGGTLANPQRKSAANEASYDAANQMTTLNTQAITYDANGNMTSDGQGNSYTWNARNQLQSISGPGGTASFTYDAVGRRSSKTINGATTGFLHDGANLIQEQDAWGAPYVNLLTGLSIDETVARYPINGGASAAEVMVTDALGSTIALTNHSGAITTSYAYDTYGGTTQTGAPSTNPIQYTGRENDGINGLYYYRARYYSTNAQRFISEDPIGLAGGVNTHAYVGGNPLSYRDPTGLVVAPAVVGVGAGVAAIGWALCPSCRQFVANGIRDLLGPMNSDGYPPGFWPGDKGAAEWGRRNGFGARDGKGRFHGIKQGCPGSRPTDNYGVDPATGDVIDPNGDDVGNLWDAKPK